MAISGWLRRMGFVKLDDFGLILTPEGRILSARSFVLDDGLGGKIVGWREDDLAAMELERWEPALPARKAGKKVIPVMPQAARAIAPAGPPPLPGVRPFTGALPLAAPAATPATPLPVVVPVAVAPIPPKPVAKRPPSEVDPAPVEEDDEWEWEIAVARARANAEWAAEAEAAKAAAGPKPKDPMQTDNWPKTEPLLEALEPSGSQDRPIRVLPRKASPTPPKPIVIAAPPVRPLPFRAAVPATEPNIFVGEQTSPTIVTSAQKPVSEHTSPAIAAPRTTVIPVPTLPSAIDPKSVIPRPRTTTAALPMRSNAAVMSPPRRMSRGTPSIANRTEDTLVNGNTAPANDDLTSPGLLAPPPASSAKRVAAKQR